MSAGPTLATRRGVRLAAPLLTGATVLAAVVALQLRDPHEQGSWGYCPVRLLTGWDCPGCGGLRAVNHLGNGDVLAAASSNLLFTLAVPVLVLAWAMWLARAWRGTTPTGARGPGVLSAATRRLRPAVVWSVAAVVVVGFAVLRNLPAGAWLQS